MEKENKKGSLKIEKMCSFNLGYRENAERLVSVVTSIGYFARIIKSSEAFIVEIYKQI